MRRRSIKLVILGIALLLGAGGSVPAILINVSQTGDSQASTDWPTAQGTVLSSSVQSHPGRHNYWEAMVGYEYAAGGQTHRSNQVGFYDAANFDDPKDARAFVAHYPVGGPATVHYDPDHPEHAVLVTGTRALGPVGIVVFALLGVLFLAGSIACFVRAARGRDKQPG